MVKSSRSRLSNLRHLAVLSERKAISARPLLRHRRAIQFLIFHDDIEQKVEIERGAPSGVFDVFFSVRAEQIVGEGAESRHDVWVLADARGFLGESCVAQVMAAVLDAPMPTNPSVPYQERGV